MTELTIHKTIDVSHRNLAPPPVRARKRPFPVMPIRARQIIEEEAAKIDVMPETLLEPCQTVWVVAARDRAIRKVRNELQLSTTALGKLFQLNQGSIVRSLQRGVTDV